VENRGKAVAIAQIAPRAMQIPLILKSQTFKNDLSILRRTR